MHVLDITMYYAEEGGGISSYLNAKSNWLARNGHVRHTILSSSVQRCSLTPSVIALPGIALPGINGYRLPRSLRTPARIVQRCRPDLLEVGDAGPCALAALHVRRRLNVPLIGFYHSDLHALVGDRFGPGAAAITGRYLRHVYNQFDLVLAPSRLMVHRLEQLGVTDAVHQPLGVDTGIFSPARRDAGLRERLGLPAGTRLLVYAGRFTPQKKLGVLIEAVRRLGRPYHLLLIGGGSALPASPNGTILPFERDPGTGLVVRPDCANSLGEGIAALFGSDMARLGANARHKACAHFDWNRIMPQLMERYTGLLASRRRAEPDPEGCLAD